MQEAKKLEKIRFQLEFYFSPSNLRRDVFLRKLIAEGRDEYVPVERLLIFHRLRDLKASSSDLCHAASKSDKLELCRCCGQQIRGREKFLMASKGDTKEEIESRTVFLQGIRSSATIEGLTKSLSNFGKILLIQIPRDKKNVDSGGGVRSEKLPNKGIAFAEFSTKQEMERCLRKLASKGKSNYPKDYELAKISKVLPKTEWVQKHGKHGMIVKLQNLGPEATNSTLQTVIGAIVDRARFVDYPGGRRIAFVRMPSPETAQELLDHITSVGLTLGWTEKAKAKMITAEILKGKVEDDYIEMEKKRIAARKLGTGKKRKPSSDITSRKKGKMY